ncbi:MAG TPA: hypothetical protein VH000_12360 [Rhizomicrobium sp.]|jgi:osmotically inducible lipoprotein OsmB|nr:hypothetical protein [Rhizomicrobium sp.]
MRVTKILAVSFLALGTVMGTANAACEHSKAVGTGVGAVGGGLIGDAVTHGSAVGVIGGAVVGGLAGHSIAGDNCDRRHYRHTGYYDRDHHWHRYASVKYPD